MFFSAVLIGSLLVSACRTQPGQPDPAASATPVPNMANPASVYCEAQGGRLEMKEDASGGQFALCVFADGSECEEWAYYRGECQPGSAGAATPQTNMPNPASAFCETNGGTVDIRTDASGGQYGVCVFPDASECDEWAYFRGECQPGSAASAATPTAAATGEVAADGCKIYRNPALGYSFHYPANASLATTDDPLKSLTISGPLVDGDNWPAIYVSHPSDREDYRPPEGADLEAWLVEHWLLPPADASDAPEERLPDTQIAGTTAIHTRFPRSPQSYAYDKYFFAQSGQLYMVVILHTGDREDWELYDHFLDSLQFEQ